ncbi:hypothetical protein HG15A2_43190 [Adhaeretor mobilis]|uniref:Uncharacterized protein n=1 Tax=Adhaeretor mobilis TaxID=1930276 RepID=A0A517N1G8_9BACT|nr:hypothetical protein HG15A2_43190 [Adhaeretor mobilis]
MSPTDPHLIRSKILTIDALSNTSILAERYLKCPTDNPPVRTAWLGTWPTINDPVFAWCFPTGSDTAEHDIQLPQISPDPIDCNNRI